MRESPMNLINLLLAMNASSLLLLIHREVEFEIFAFLAFLIFTFKVGSLDPCWSINES